MEEKLYHEIYAYLSTQFKPGEEVLSTVLVKQLLTGGFVPAKYGYSNMREMFADLEPILMMKTTEDGRMMVKIRAAIKKGDWQQSASSVSEYTTRVRRGNDDIGLLSGKSLDEDVKGESKFSLSQIETKSRQTMSKNSEIMEPDSLSDEIKQKIYTAVVLGLQLEKPLYMSTLSPVLRYAGVQHDKLGFVKSKNMLKRCSDFMDFEEVMMNGVPQTLVTVHHVPKWDTQLIGVSRPSSSEKLDDAEKKRIYDVLCQHMKFGEAIHMAAFSPILKTYGFDYRKYGFQKVKELSAELHDFLSLQEVVMNGVPQTLVTLHEMGQSPICRQQGYHSDKHSQELHQIAFLPPKILGLLSRMTGSPVWACEEALEQSYIQAKNNGTLSIERKHITRKGVVSSEKEMTMRFPLTLKTMRSDALMGELHESGSDEGKRWFLAWVGSPQFVRKTELGEENTEDIQPKEYVLTPDFADCCALSDSVVRAAAFKALHCTEEQARNMIVNDYATAYGTDAMAVNGEEYYYPLVSAQTAQIVYVLLTPNRIGEKPFYVRFVGANLVFSASSQQHASAVEQIKSLAETADKEPVFEIRMDNAPLPDELEDLSFLPQHTVSLLAHECGMLEEQMLQQLNDSYQECRETGKIARRPDEIRFALLQKNLKGEEVTVYLRPSEGGDKNWFFQYFEGKEIEKEESCVKEPSALEQFAFLGDWDGQMRLLSQLAAPEKWDFVDNNSFENLKYYMDGCFERIESQDKMVFNAEKNMAAFNTGLMTRYGHDIYAQFSKNLPGSKLPWRFERFVSGRVASDFVSIPLVPSYLDGRNSPWFEPDRNIMPFAHDVILSKIRTLPREFLRRYSHAFEISLIEQMNLDERLSNGCYARLEECYRKNVEQLDTMIEAINRSIHYALHRVRRDYCYAVAGYLPNNDKVVWMLPLTLQGNANPDVVIAFTMEYGSYCPTALLTLKEAYLAARFVRRLDHFWLNAVSVDRPENE